MLEAIRSIEQTCGTRPLGWYCRYGPSVNTRELLVEEGGFVYDSDAYNDDLPYFTEVNGKQHLILPYTLTYNDGNFVLGDYAGPQTMFDYMKRGFDYLWEEGADAPRMMSVCCVLTASRLTEFLKDWSFSPLVRPPPSE